MNAALVAALLLVPALAGSGLVAATARTGDRLVALQLATVFAILILVLLGVAEDQPSFLDLALTLVLLTFPGTLVYAHFLERWL